ncbi:hypothetical protein Acsp03_02060 [Actinomadura sp. NBRC 104412]|uniref:hypothetical protein n=1 Tax=Actinomadura sp. NBRC 104412 TaxID=3032203 RepID=UPI0024A09598|nr:hypothetical protein [Actinomadura sp. NBRC 104412]GLZ02739.1 hypothetical protein Acsp03_02060 [Actinomadura sp. NBRC 104412]
MTGAPMRAALALAFCAGTIAAILGIGVRATYAGHVAVDEPQYLLTALSLYEDGDLDIADELAERRWRVYYDRELPVQTEVLPGGRQISPHDPLLPVLLAVPMGLFGWVGAKVALSLFAGALAAVVLWTAIRRFEVPPRIAVPGVVLAAVSAPFAVYGQQVYPEVPAALAVATAVAALTAERPSPLVIGVVLTALPWLSVKYAPVAAVLAVLTLWRLWRAGMRRELWALTVGLTLMGVLYLWVHRVVWGGWTVYATGDHFQKSGEFGVMGFDPDYADRALRLTGLLIDRGYGLAAWQPGWLLLVPAVAAAVRLRPRGAAALVLPLTAGWLTATFVALTMRGNWWPGRQTVVVLPLALLLILWWLARCAPPVVRRVALVAGCSGVLAYGWLLAEGYARTLTWVSGFQSVGYPGYRLLRPLLPPYHEPFTGFVVPHLVWIAVFVLFIRYSSINTKGNPHETPHHPSRRPDPGPDQRADVRPGRVL